MAGISYSAEASPSRSNWSDLFSSGHLAVVVVMAGGVLLYAMNLYFTAALMPSIVADIGGREYYAWVTTGFVIAAIIASLFVSRLIEAKGVPWTYMLAFFLFALGAVAAAASPTMGLVILGRVIQGFGGGLLAGLGYAVIRVELPAELWGRATGVISAMWGLGTLFGPALGGIFAQFGLWRWAYGALAIVSLLLMILVRRSFTKGALSGIRSSIPFASLVPLVLATVTISISAILPIGWPTFASIGAGIALLALFAMVERRSVNTILPRITYQGGNPLKWVYLTVAALSAGVMLEVFIPLFAQQLAGLNPLVAGLLGAVLSLAWVLAQLYSVSLSSEAARRRAIRSGPILLALGLLAYGLSQTADAPLSLVLLWALMLAVAGAGIGLAWPLLGVAAMSSTSDPAEGGKAAAAITTTQLIAFSITSALAGTLLATENGSHASAASGVSLGIAALCAFGIASAVLATRRQ